MDYARTEFLAKDNPETAYKFDGKDYPLKGSPLAALFPPSGSMNAPVKVFGRKMEK